MKKVLKGEIYLVDLGKRIGSEQGGLRPVLVIQNDIGNKFSPTVIVAVMTTRHKSNLPTHFELNTSCGIKHNSTVLFEQLLTIDKSRLIRKIGQVTSKTLQRLDEVCKVSLGIT